MEKLSNYTLISYNKYVQNLNKRRKRKEPTITVTRTQVELAFFIRNYRRIHELSQPQMAKICTLYGEPHNVKFSASDICGYENYKHMPTTLKFQVLLNTMDLDPTDL